MLSEFLYFEDVELMHDYSLLFISNLSLRFCIWIYRFSFFCFIVSVSLKCEISSISSYPMKKSWIFSFYNLSIFFSFYFFEIALFFLFVFILLFDVCNEMLIFWVFKKPGRVLNMASCGSNPPTKRSNENDEQLQNDRISCGVKRFGCFVMGGFSNNRT